MFYYYYGKQYQEANLQAEDKENLSKDDLISLIGDHNRTLWKHPQTKKLVRCTIHRVDGKDVASMCCINMYIMLILQILVWINRILVKR